MFLLLDELRTLLKEEFTHPRFREDNLGAESYSSIKFFIGQLPTEAADRYDYPYIILQAIGGMDTEESSWVDVKIMAGAYNPSGLDNAEKSLQDALNIISRCRIALQKVQNIGVYSLKHPLIWSAGDPDTDNSQPNPYAKAEIVTSWVTKPINKKVEDYLE